VKSLDEGGVSTGGEGWREDDVFDKAARSTFQQPKVKTMRGDVRLVGQGVKVKLVQGGNPGIITYLLNLKQKWFVVKEAAVNDFQQRTVRPYAFKRCD
jgi:hypothetical protein